MLQDHRLINRKLSSYKKSSTNETLKTKWNSRNLKKNKKRSGLCERTWTKKNASSKI